MCPYLARKSSALIFIPVLSTARALYVIRRRRKTGTFTKSRMTAKAAAAARVPATIEAGKDFIAKPPMANVEAIIRSATDDTTSQKLGREDHSRRRSRWNPRSQRASHRGRSGQVLQSSTKRSARCRHRVGEERSPLSMSGAICAIFMMAFTLPAPIQTPELRQSSARSRQEWWAKSPG